MQHCERYLSKNILDRAYGRLLYRLELSSDLSKNTRRLNRLLGIFKLRICKDCQKLSSAKNLRCKDCRLDHDEYLRERLTQEYQDDLRAEYESELENEPEDYRSDLD